MLRSLVRLKFLDRTLTGAALDDLATFWSRVCCLAEGVRPDRWHPEYALEIRLSGFPRAAGSDLLNALTRRTSALGAVVTSADPDTLVVAWLAGDMREPPGGLGLRVVAGEEFEGLVVEIRLAVAGRSRGLTSTATVGRTLVVVGELRAKALLVKSLWAGLAWASESAIQNMPTGWEPELLLGFDDFCKTGVISPRLPCAADFPSPSRKPDLHERISAVPFGRPRLKGLLIRFAAFAVGLALGIATIGQDWNVFIIIFLFVFWIALFHQFFRNEFYLLFDTFDAQRAACAAGTRAQRYAVLTPEQTTARLNDPAVRKYTTDALAAGFVHIADVASVPFEHATTIYRIFHATDGATSLAIRCDTHTMDDRNVWSLWPATVGLECQTFFSDGGRVDSVADAVYLPRVTNWPESTRLLAIPTATDPLALYQTHREAVDEVLGEMAVTTVRHEPFDVYLRRQEQISEAEHQAYVARPYSWRDHLRWYLQLDAKPPENSK